MPELSFLAIDLGAESGRAMLGRIDERLTLDEVHRFPNGPVHLANSIRWDVMRLWAEIQNGLSLAARKYPGQIVSVGADTWGVEVRPNETTEANQPWHWVVIPAMGLCMGEIFYLKELAEDCEQDGIYEFFFCGPPLIITGGTGSPINPQAIK